MIRLGNLDVASLERHLGIKFTENDRLYMENTRQENMSIPLKPESWHFFDLPKSIHFGSLKALNAFRNILANYELKGSLEATFDLDEATEKPQAHYNLYNENGYPRFLFVKTKYTPIDAYTQFGYMQLVKENKRTLVYRAVGTKGFEESYLGITDFIMHKTLVPNEDEFHYQEIKLDKNIFEEPFRKNIVYAGYRKFGTLVDKKELEIISIWNGELHKDYIEREAESQFLEQIENYKKHVKLIKKSKEGS